MVRDGNVLFQGPRKNSYRSLTQPEVSISTEICTVYDVCAKEIFYVQ